MIVWLYWLLCVVALYAIALNSLWLLLARATTAPACAREVEQPVTVLVPCYNEAVVIAATLESLTRSQGVQLEQIICIDDGSTDQTWQCLLNARQQLGERLTLLQQPNKGKAHALNHGLTQVRTAWFVSIDADTQVLPDTLAELLAAIDSPQVAAVSGHMLVANQRPRNLWLYHGQVLEYACANHLERQASSVLRQVAVVPGAVGAFKSDAVRQVGGYPTGTLAEDADLTVELLFAGFHTVHQPHALALTEVPADASNLMNQRLRWATGYLQVLKRQMKTAFRRGHRPLLIWLHLAINHCIAPVMAAVAGLSTLGLAIAAFNAHRLAVGGLLFACVLNGALGALAYRVAVRRDAAARARLGLPVSNLRLAGLILVWGISCLATLRAWGQVASGRPGGWRKVRRYGDVNMK